MLMLKKNLVREIEMIVRITCFSFDEDYQRVRRYKIWLLT